MTSRLSLRAKRRRPLGWILAAALALQSLIGLMPMPARAHAAAPASSAQDATSRLLADLAVLCTPYGLRVMGKSEIPAKPTGKIGHDICVLCGLAAGASLGLVQAAPVFEPPSASWRLSLVAVPALPVRWSEPLLPPGRGPPT